MKKPFAMLCGTVALFCLVSMFIPIIAPRFPTSTYHPGSEGYTREYFLDGDYYVAREYWSVARFALASGDNVKRIALSVSMALMLYWSMLSFMGEDAVKAGLIASILNLAVTGWIVIQMLGLKAGVRPLVLGVVLMDVVAAVVVAVAAVPVKRRYTRPYQIHTKSKG